MSNQLYLCDRTLRKTMNMEACVNSPGWQSSGYIVSYQCRESNAVPTLWGKGQLEGLYLEPSCHLSRALFPLTDFNLYPLAVMKK